MDYSLADIKAATGEDRDGFDGSGWGIWLILLFLFFGFNRGGFGSGTPGNPATTEDVQNQFNFSALERQNNETVAAVRQSTFDTVTNAKDLAAGLNTGIRDIEAAVAQNGYQLSQCCCETNRNIDSVRYDSAMNTDKITTAIHAEGEATRALINQNTIQDLRDKVSDLQLAQSQCNQNAYLTNTLRPYPVPAYMTCSPYGYGSCSGCGNCGC